MIQEVLAAGSQHCSRQHWELWWLWGVEGENQEQWANPWFPVLVALMPAIFCGVSKAERGGL